MNSIEAKKQIKVLRETKDYLAVYKPAGLAVESRSLTGTDLEHVLRGTEERWSYLAPINRIDQPVEGIVLFAKHKAAAAALSGQLQTHKMQKEYLAVVRGVPAERNMHLIDYLRRIPKENRSEVTDKNQKDAKKAELSFVCEKEKEGCSLLRIRLYTGRHHQIRVQLANAGLPILGDRKYNAEDDGQFASPALCSSRLVFADLSGKEVSVEAVPRGAAFKMMEA